MKKIICLLLSCAIVFSSLLSTSVVLAVNTSKKTFESCFDDMEELRVTSSSTFVPSEMEANLIYSTEYDAVAVTGSAELSDEIDHTTGSGKSVKLHVNESSTNNRIRTKFFNFFKQSAFTTDDIGNKYTVTMWAYSPTDLNITVCTMALAQIQAMLGTSWWNSAPKYKTDVSLTANTWEKITFAFTLSEEDVYYANQTGMLTIQTASGTDARTVYIDDVQVFEGDPPAMQCQFVKNNETQLNTDLKITYDPTIVEPNGSSVEVYVLKDGYSYNDYTNEEAVYKKEIVNVSSEIIDVVVDLRTLEELRNDLNVVIVGVDNEDGYIYESITYENAYLNNYLIEQIIQATSSETIKELLKNETNIQIIGIESNSIFNSLDVEGEGFEYISTYLYDARNDVLNEQDASDVSLVKAALERALVYYILNSSSYDGVELVEFVDSYDTIIFGDDSSIYETFDSIENEEIKANIATRLNEKDFSYGDDEYIINIFASALFDIIKVVEDADVLEIIENNSEYMGIDYSQYDSLDDEYKDTVKEEIIKFFVEIPTGETENVDRYTNLGNTISGIIREIKISNSKDAYKYEMDFENMPSEGLMFIQKANLDPNRENNFIHHDKYFAYIDGSAIPIVELSTTYNHTEGGAWSVSSSNKYDSSKNEYVGGRIKLFNTLKDSDLTYNDLGKQYNISFWVYSEKECTVYAALFALAGIDGREIPGQSFAGSPYYHGSTTIKKDFSIPANEWTKCEYSFVLSEEGSVKTDSYDDGCVARQAGLITLGVGNSTSEQGRITAYFDDIIVEEAALRINVKQNLNDINISVNAVNTENNQEALVKIFDKDDVLIAERKDTFNEDGCLDLGFDLSNKVSNYYNDVVVQVTTKQNGKEQDFFKSFTYKNEGLTEEKLTNINSATSKEQIKNVLATGVEDATSFEILGISDIPAINKIVENEKMIQYLFDNKGSLSAHNFVEMVTEQSILVGFNEGLLTTVEADNMINKYADKIGITDKNYYDEIYKGFESVSVAKSSVFSEGLFHKNFVNISDIATLMPMAVIEAAAKDSNLLSNELIAIMISDNVNDLNMTNWNNYTSLSDTPKKKANDLIVAHIKEYGIETLNANLSQIAEEAKKSGQGGSSGGTSSPKGQGKESSTSGSLSFGSEVVGNKVSSSFNDLNDALWAKEYIVKMSEKGIISGYEDNTFRPNKSITREEFAKLLAMTFGISVDNNTVLTFKDVKNGDWSYGYIAALYSKGIINGINDDMFGSKENITRQDMATLIYRTVKALNINLKNGEKNSFVDADKISSYSVEAVNALSRANVISGKGNNEFMPLDNTTRAEVAKVLSCFVK